MPFTLLLRLLIVSVCMENVLPSSEVCRFDGRECLSAISLPFQLQVANTQELNPRNM